MGRKAKPKSQKELQNRKPNPSPEDKLKADDPISISEMADPPAYLHEYAVEEWNKIVPKLANKGILAELDMTAVILYCDAFAEWRRAKEILEVEGREFVTDKGYRMPNPNVAIANKNHELSAKMLKEFGLTPASRKKIVSESGTKENDYERWQRRNKKIAEKGRKKKDK